MTWFQFLLTRPSRGATGRKVDAVEELRISTHTPLAGRDEKTASLMYAIKISTHTPLAGRDCCASRNTAQVPISTHTPLAGRDPYSTLAPSCRSTFLLTRPSRGATFYLFHFFTPFLISTHTPLAGRDDSRRISGWLDDDFYSHAPRGARP